MLIAEILARNARRFGEDVALIEREPAKESRRQITWREFDAQANQVAQALMRKGIRKGDRVVHLMMNCLEWLPIYFGILRTGAWAVPLNFRFGAETIRMCIETAEAKAIFFGEEFIDRIHAIKPDIDRMIETYIFVGPADVTPDYTVDYDVLIGTEKPIDPAVPIEITDEAALYFTSGTTGFPKGALLTHRNLEASCYVENRHHLQTKADNFLCIPPLYHTGAKMHWFGNFIVGAKAVILKGINPKWILNVISEEAVSVVWLLVPWAQDILLAIENGDVNLNDYDLSQWRLMHIGAQPVPRSLVNDWKRVFPHHKYDTNYGLTEATGPGCLHLGIENLHKVGAIGLPGFDWEAAVVDENLDRVPKGMIGELAIRGPCVMKCYYKNPEATAETLKEGWLLTGDIAKEDDDGFFWLVDRKKDIIITGGENIYPVEIEDYLQSHPEIQDVAVIGLPDQRLGEIAVAVIQVKPGHELSAEDISSFCRKLPRYKQPRQIIFGEVPRNPTGKIEKPKIRKQYAGIAESFKND